MNVDVSCPQCGTVFTIKRELLGKRTKCTKCGTIFTLTEPAAGPGAKAAAPSPGASSVFSEIHTAPHSEPPDVPQFTVDTTPRAADRPRQSSAFPGIEQNSSRPRFPALRIVARAYEVMAIISFAFAVLLVLMFFVTVLRHPDDIIAVALTSGVPFFGAVVAAVTMLFAAQTIRLWLQVEQNTRETHLACRQLADHLCSVETEP